MFRMASCLFSTHIGMSNCWMMSGDMKLSVAPLLIRVSTSDINYTDQRLTEVWMEEFLGARMASGNMALSIATCCGPSENLFPCHAFLRPIVLVGCPRV